MTKQHTQPTRLYINGAILGYKRGLGKINVGKVNVDHNPNLSVNYGITSIPAILFIKGGQIVDKQIGAVPKSVLDKKIQAHM